MQVSSLVELPRTRREGSCLSFVLRLTSLHQSGQPLMHIDQRCAWPSFSANLGIVQHSASHSIFMIADMNLNISESLIKRQEGWNKQGRDASRRDRVAEPPGALKDR